MAVVATIVVGCDRLREQQQAKRHDDRGNNRAVGIWHGCQQKNSRVAINAASPHRRNEAPH